MKNIVTYEKELNFFLKTLEYSKVNLRKEAGFTLSASDVGADASGAANTA